MTSVVPIEYLNTHMLCRWRFILEGGIESDRTAESLIPELLNKKENVLLTRLGKKLTVISRPVVQKSAEKAVINLNLPAQSHPPVYGKTPRLHCTGDGWLATRGVLAALGALVAGGIVDEMNDERPYGAKYRNYVRERFPDRFKLMVNNLPYHKFDAAQYLLINVLAAKNKEHTRHLERHFKIDDFSAPCNACPFSPHCDVSLNGGISESQVRELSKALAAAMYLEHKDGTGWYLLYRVATRIVGYRKVSLTKALSVELRHMGYVMKNLLIDDESLKKCLTHTNLSTEEREYILENAETLLHGECIYEDIPTYLENELVASLIKKGFLSPVKIHTQKSYSADITVVSLSAGPKLNKCLWGGDEND